ncbi:MAG: recombinase family protein [Candidatus Dormiibacterota bacterium]
MNTAIYVRLSSDRHDDHQAVDRQLEDCRRKVEGPALVFEDNNKSAWTRGGGRPEYRRLLGEVKAGNVDRIVVWHIDRLYRQMGELSELTDLARDGRGVIIDPVSGMRLDLTTADGVMMAQHFVSTAQHESSHKGERVRRAQQQKREQGKPHGGPRAFGWKKDGMTPEPKEAKEIVRAVELLFAGQSLKDIARLWNEKGLKRTLHPDSLWAADSIRRTVSNPRHAGRMTHDLKRKGSYQRTDIGKAQWPAIIEPDRFQALMALLASRSRATTGIPKRRSLLTRLVVCGTCGTPMTHAKDHNMEFYRCPHKRPEIPNACGGVSVNAKFLETFLTEATLQRADTGELAKLIRAQSKDAVDGTKLFARMETLDHRLAELGTMFADGAISGPGFASADAKIRSEKDALQKQLASASSTSVLAPFASRPGALRTAWPTLTQDQQRAVIGTMLGKVRIMPTAVRGRHVFDSKRVQIAKR